MLKLLSPKLDIVFKKLFVQDPSLLLELLNAMFAFYQQPALQSIEIRNPEILPIQDKRKKIILDLLACDAEGQLINIEMQSQSVPHYPARTLFYLARLLSGQLSAGEDYGTLRPVLGIHFLNFVLYSGAQWQYWFQLREAMQSDLCYCSHLQIFLFELPKMLHVLKKAPAFLQWLDFFNHPEAEDSMADVHPAIARAREVLKEISADEKFRYEALAHEMFLHDEATRLKFSTEKAKAEGHAEGHAEGVLATKITIARQLLATGMPLAQVALVTDLPNDLLENLKSNL